MPRIFRNRTARIVAVKTNVAREVTPEQLENEVLRITRQIHGLTAKRRALRSKIAEISKQLKGQRRALKIVLQSRALQAAPLNIGDLTPKE